MQFPSRLNIRRITLGIVVFSVMASFGCKKLVEVPPPEAELSSISVYASDPTAIAVQTGLYENIMGSNSLTGGGIIDISFYPALSSDDLTLWSGNTNPTFSAYYTNALSNQNVLGTDFWSIVYPMIYVVNSSIENLNQSKSLTPAVQQQLLGEAEFIRAFCYFYLVNLYGDVPLILTPSYTENITIPRTPQSQVWQQIITDLKAAQNLLSSQYLDGTLLNPSNSRVRPTKWAAAALLARTYLYNGQWTNAINEADSVIANNSLYVLDTLNGVFLANSSEAIWQLQPIAAGWNSPDAQLFIIPSTGLSDQWPVYLSNSLLNSFEPGDQRRVNWVDSIVLNGITYYYPYKYKNNTYNTSAQVTEYEMVLRLGEQYLIRAEAEAELNDLTDATTDVNTIRNRANLGPLDITISGNQSALLSAIQHERQVELFTEWGHRWLDLKRTATIDEVMGSPGNAYLAKIGGSGNWNLDWQWYPILYTQLQLDPNLVQNQGY